MRWRYQRGPSTPRRVETWLRQRCTARLRRRRPPDHRHPMGRPGRGRGDRRRSSARRRRGDRRCARSRGASSSVAAAVTAVAGAPGPARRPRRARTGCAVVRSDEPGSALAPDRLGPFRGWVAVVVEPHRSAGSTGVLLQVEGERYEAVGARPGPASSASPAGSTATGCGSTVDAEPLDHDRRRRAWRGSTSSASSTLAVARRPSRAGDRSPWRRTASVRSSSAARRRAPGRRGGAGPRSGHRRRPRRAAGDDPALPATAACPPDRRVGQNVAFVLAAAGPLLRAGPPVRPAGP